MKRKIKGFTLMELVITLIIVITLSLISWPIYRGRHREYSMLAEGYALLGAIKEAQINYYNEYGYFYARENPYQLFANNAWTSIEPGLGINAINNKYFSYFNAFDGVYGGWYSRTGHNNYYFAAVVASSNAGTISMIFNLTERNEPVVNNANNVTFF